MMVVSLRKALSERTSNPSGIRLLPAPEPNRADHPYVGTIVYQGLLIYVENTKGSKRSGTAPDGTRWSVRMPAHYGEFAGTLGMDGDPVDVFVGDDPDAPDAFVVHQKVPGTQRPDEDKVILGVRTAAEAKALFMSAYTKPGFFGGMTRWSLADLRAHLLEGRAPGTRLDLPPHLQAMVKAARSSWMLRALLKNAQLTLFGGGAPAKHTKVVTVKGHVRRDGTVVPSHVRHVLVDDDEPEPSRPPEPPEPPEPPKPPTLNALRAELTRLVDELMPDREREDPDGFDAQGLAELRAYSAPAAAYAWDMAAPPTARDGSSPPQEVLDWAFAIFVAENQERLAMHDHRWRNANNRSEYQRMATVVDTLIVAGSDATLEGSGAERTLNYSNHLADNVQLLAQVSSWSEAVDAMKRAHGSSPINMSAIKAKARAEAVALVQAEEAKGHRYWFDSDRKEAIAAKQEQVLRDSWAAAAQTFTPRIRKWRAAAQVGSLLRSPPTALVERADRDHPNGWEPGEYGREVATDLGYRVRTRSMDRYQTWLDQAQRNEDYHTGQSRQRRLDYLAGINMPHWGSATSDNETGRMTSVYGDHGMYRPLDRAMAPHQVVTDGVDDDGTRLTLTPMQQLTGVSRAVKARQGMARFSRADHPKVYRGMTLPLHVLEAAIAHKHIPLTGCTAFSFDQSVAEHYSSSAWTKERSGPGPTVAVVLHLERDQHFDDSIAGWNPKTRNGENRPAFEIVSGIAGIRVTHAARRDDGTWDLHVEGAP